MKHLAKLAALVAVVGLWSCSDDAPDVNPGGEESNGDFYAKITLQLPTVNSRSTTEDDGDPAHSSDDYEFGQENENNVGSIQVVLASRTGEAATGYTYSFISSAIGVPQKVTSGAVGGDQPTFLLQFRSSELESYVKDGEKTAYVFAFCNYDTEITAATFANGNLTGSISDGGTTGNPIAISIAQPNNFLMTNAKIVDTTISAWSDLVKENNTPQTAFDLGKVPVERVACRFDFQATTPEGSSLNTYPIYPNGDDSQDAYANILLTDMALFNEEKEFYLLRHVSTDGTLTNSTLCGNETSSNYVVSPDFAAKAAWTTLTTVPDNLVGNFFFPLATIAQTANWTSLGTPTTDDNDGSSSGFDTWPSQGTEYKIWRYATENTIPAPESLQKNGITTGIIFRGELKPLASPTAGLATDLKNAIEAHQPIYAYRDGINAEEGYHQNNKSNLNMIFGDAMAAWKYAKGQTNDIRNNIVKAIRAGVFTLYADTDEETEIEVTATTSEEVIFGDAVKAVKANITANAQLKAYNLICYAPTQDSNGDYHYYNYYYYFNKHNTNADNSVMGPMEFATVRNNIYKLKVSTISAIGLPQDTPPDPWTPDEDPEVYFKVSVRVLDWVVRINNIEF